MSVTKQQHSTLSLAQIQQLAMIHATDLQFADRTQEYGTLSIKDTAEYYIIPKELWNAFQSLKKVRFDIGNGQLVYVLTRFGKKLFIYPYTFHSQVLVGDELMNIVYDENGVTSIHPSEFCFFTVELAEKTKDRLQTQLAA
jgi:hypothetical protein